MPPKLIFGAGGIGKGNISHAWTNAEETSSLLDTLSELHITQLDSAASYPPGAPWVTERLLGESKAVEKGFVVDTKIMMGAPKEGEPGPLSEAEIDKSIKKSLDLLGVKSVNIMYAHAPDAKTPMLETAKAFDKHFKAGVFKELGLCNYTFPQMNNYLNICKEHSLLRPTVWQGHYNAIVRNGEEKLFPLLRENGIRINAYGPLAGGFLTGKVTQLQNTNLDNDPTLKSGRWANNNLSLYPSTFHKPSIHAAMTSFLQTCSTHSISPTEASLRWIMFHSALREGDGIIIGASRVEMLRGNVEVFGKGRLGEGEKEVLEAIERLWGEVRGEGTGFEFPG